MLAAGLIDCHKDLIRKNEALKFKFIFLYKIQPTAILVGPTQSLLTSPIPRTNSAGVGGFYRINPAGGGWF